MKNIHMEYSVAGTDELPAYTAQAYIRASDHVEAEKKLKAFLGKDTKFTVTQFNDANAEVIE